MIGSCRLFGIKVLSGPHLFERLKFSRDSCDHCIAQTREFPRVWMIQSAAASVAIQWFPVYVFFFFKYNGTKFIGRFKGFSGNMSSMSSSCLFVDSTSGVLYV